MCLVQYSAKFMPDVASVAKPIRELTRKGVTFRWEEEQHTPFRELKRIINQAESLAYFKVDCRRIVGDASPVGLGAVLTQVKGRAWRGVSYTPSSLADMERRYSQTEKEAFALVWACERFNMYLSAGRSFELETDHKLLELIYSRTSKPCARIERWVLRLQGYDFKVM